MKIINKENLKKYALNYLKRYASSKKNLERKLLNRVIKNNYKKSGINQNYESYIKEILEDLEKNKIINDEDFANSKIFNYIRMGKSKKLIEYNLLQKGVDKKDIINAFEKIESDTPNLEIDSAINFAKKKKLGQYGDYDNKKKDLSKMARAGFSYSVSLKALGLK
ncbi:MAG: Regulatory protein RecX [Alphaproteobacteria bacterium MarineAlpha5_Bin11]|nr:hypothetical protein [Pelagibacteraceae bacterium]PPR43662.1 MAG: Regulatory protein RecX [Alphaproteobacteria bacterium MarineAlpha5_Bin11]PPR51160.1 MAG: Regulatory protein RecX [Alphaproteobacteria bacterium MarineAlpha5_Bin10]|tara:strand:+ start:17511 stop:18005 length:495 start_codon:yes stop_codon:yes gene_type:complete